MATPFLFDTEFGADLSERRSGDRRSGEAARLEAERQAAEARGYEHGRQAGLAEAKGAAEARSAAALDRIGSGLGQMLAALDETRARLERDTIEIAVCVGRKLAPALVAREPVIEVAALAARCLPHLREAPHIVVRLRAEEAAIAKPLIERLARDRGHEGRLVVLGEPDIRAGDCRIEWAEGGFVREMATIEAEIEGAVARHLAGRDGDTGA